MSWARVKELLRQHAAVLFLILVICGVVLADRADFLSLVASTGTVGTTRAALFIVPRNEAFAVERTVRLDVRIRSDVPINAVGATLSFDPAAIEIVGFSKEDSFLDLWAEETSIQEESGEVHFSGGTLGKDGFAGVGTLLTLVVRPKQEGETIITFADTAVLAADGRGTAVVHDQQPLALAIHASTTESSATSTRLTSDFNTDGRITAADLSLFTVQLFLPYSERYDLDRNGAVELADLRVFIEEVSR